MNKISIFIIFLYFLTSCSSQDAFTLKKKSSIDEFLVEKKNPLVLPPEFGKLPVPENNNVGENNKDDNNIKDMIIKKKTNSSSVKNNNSKKNSLEKIILEKIR